MSSGWFSLYCAAMLERDRNKAVARIEHALNAIRDRVAQLDVTLEKHAREEHELSKAGNHLAILLQYANTETGRMLWD